MLSPSKRILSEYKPLIVKMVEDNSTINTTRTNYKLFCDVEMFLRVTCVMPLLEAMQCLTKFA
jgi:hypothetical protein